MTTMHNPPHPGEILREYLEDFSISVTDAAEKLGITRVSLSRILNGKSGISADMAWRLADSLGTSPELWTGLQAMYDLWQCQQQPRPTVKKMSRENHQAA